MSWRQKILVLADEIMPGGLPPRTRLLLDGLARDSNIVLVAQCYLAANHRARRPGHVADLYSFAAEGYDAKVSTLAAGLVTRHAPDLVLAYGWENAKLVVALDALDIPIVSFTDYMTRHTEGQGQLNRIFRHATEIVLHDTIPPRLTLARYGLDARVFTTVTTSLDGILAQRGWLARLRREASLESLGAGAADLHELMAALAGACIRAAASGPARERDRRVIGASNLFNRDLHDPDDTRSNEDALGGYLRSSRFALPRDRVLAGRLVRRPMEGFNPLIYAADSAGFHEEAGEDPFAHWIRRGRPEGRWTHEVIRAAPARAARRVAVHIHLHYPELLAEFLKRLAANATPPDLFVTTTSDAKLSEIARVFKAAGFAPKALRICPNLGRDLWPFVALAGAGKFDGYDVIGHFHSKRSPHMELGDDWRDFLWSHLVGGPEAMLDVIAARFASDPTLGLVFAEEPHLEGWELNKEIATKLAERVGIATPLPNHFDYPMGTMFWARPAALSTLLALGLTAEEIPPEPLAVDGTILHALERLLPFLVAKAGYRYATTYVPGSRR